MSAREKAWNEGVASRSFTDPARGRGQEGGGFQQ